MTPDVRMVRSAGRMAAATAAARASGSTGGGPAAAARNTGKLQASSGVSVTIAVRVDLLHDPARHRQAIAGEAHA
jgi:hypothetical protein